MTFYALMHINFKLKLKRFDFGRSVKIRNSLTNIFENLNDVIISDSNAR